MERNAPENQRQSDRIRYAYRIRIAGIDSAGYQFEEDARTEVITRDGGMIVSGLSLNSGGHLKLTRGDQEVEARVVGQVGIRNEEYMYGVQFMNDSRDFWPVKFPDVRASDGVGRGVLQCSRCNVQEVLALGEIEMIVFEDMKVIPHQCGRCKDETLWMSPVLLGDTELVTGSASFDPTGGVAYHRPRTINDRKHNRIEMKRMRACIHHDNYADDEVDVLDISRGGIRFVSLIDYAPGTRVDVAVPYTKDGANVFSPARIARVKCRPTASLPGEFGLEYIK